VNDMDDRWCILRMSGGATLSVVKSLTESGFRVWTPVVAELKRAGPHRKEVRRPAPLVPSIVFAQADRLHDLVVLSQAPALTHRRFNRETGRMEMRGCPYFSVFRDQGHYPLIPDGQLEALRRAEWRGRSREAEHNFQPNDRVRCEQTSYAGMVGLVRRVNRGKVKVLWPEALHEWEFDACDLVPVETAA
jgi:hypothetical protein